MASRTRSLVGRVPAFGTAMVSDPEVLERPALLLVGAVLLAAVGVARRWFAPILATAVIGVAVALAQVVAEEALVPRWMSAAFIGGILLSLLILPLYIPVLIFGAGAVEATVTGVGAQAHLSLLAALSLVGIFFAPWPTAAALRIALE